MRDERFEVTVTFDERRGYIASAPELRHPRYCLTTFASCCSSMVSPSGDVIGGRRRRAKQNCAA